MFKTVPGYRMPTSNIDEIRIYPASLGGGIVMELSVGGKREMMVFASQQALEQNLFAMFRAASITQAANQPPAGAQIPRLPQGVPAAELAKVVAPQPEPEVKKAKGGRPKGSKNKPKANGHDATEPQAKSEVEATKEAEVALS